MPVDLRIQYFVWSAHLAGAGLHQAQELHGHYEILVTGQTAYLSDVDGP